ncbi:uncharacterized protein LOC110843625 [Folsomia candida]|uniref:Uncharacterized protein n=1 Tax=Folsomia candida TaxID=158441 RepID=A0A226EQR9_FOLCA|nr:uncharacterized protein LOC110843625 [Folsomia candida]OXA59394.1 hypothetical protein Fcan01_06362 [Folsomia candida]
MAKSLTFSALLLSSLLILLPRGRAAPQGHNAVNYQNVAVQKWITSTFIQTFTKYQTPSDQDAVTAGSNLFATLKSSDSADGGISGAISDATPDQLKQIVDNWHERSVISSDSAEEQKTLVASANLYKKIFQTVHIREDGDLMFGVVGFAKTSREDGGKGTVLYSFRKYQFNKKPTEVSYVRDENNCAMWGVICPTSFYFDDFSEEDNRHLETFMLSEAIKQFVSDNSAFITYINQIAAQFRPFLPKGINNALTKIEEQSDHRPDQVLESDPFSAENLEKL